MSRWWKWLRIEIVGRPTIRFRPERRPHAVANTVRMQSSSWRDSFLVSTEGCDARPLVSDLMATEGSSASELSTKYGLWPCAIVW